MIRLIAAVDRNLGIAKGGVQPWNIPQDEVFFRNMTLKGGANILRGRREFEVYGHPMPDRRNFVATTNRNLFIPGVAMVFDLVAFMNEFPEDLWVIGGATIYEQTIGRADEVYLTRIDADFGCDQHFPIFEQGFELRERSDLHEENGFIFTYDVYTTSTS